MRVTALYVHPVKGCRAVAVNEALLGALGVERDRRFAFARGDGLALTQRDEPLLATIRPVLDEHALHLDLGGLARISIPLQSFSAPASVEVWGNRVPARAAADDAVAAAADYLGTRVRLVMLDPAAPRAFVDSRPVLVTTTGMLSRLKIPGLSMDRFRPNVVLEGAEGSTLLEGKGVLLERDKPCGRCEVTTIDQTSGTRQGPEPLRTLTERFDGNFGVYYRVARGGRLLVGEVLKAS